MKNFIQSRGCRVLAIFLIFSYLHLVGYACNPSKAGQNHPISQQDLAKIMESTRGNWLAVSDRPELATWLFENQPADRLLKILDRDLRRPLETDELLPIRTKYQRLEDFLKTNRPLAQNLLNAARGIMHGDLAQINASLKKLGGASLAAADFAVFWHTQAPNLNLQPLLDDFQSFYLSPCGDQPVDIAASAVLQKIYDYNRLAISLAATGSDDDLAQLILAEIISLVVLFVASHYAAYFLDLALWAFAGIKVLLNPYFFLFLLSATISLYSLDQIITTGQEIAEYDHGLAKLILAVAASAGIAWVLSQFPYPKPQLINIYESQPRAIALVGDTLYLLQNNGQLGSIDVRDPQQPKEIGATPISGVSPQTISITNQTLAVISSSCDFSRRISYLDLFDITDQTVTPRKMATLEVADTCFQAQGVEAPAAYIYDAATSQIDTIDISTPSQPAYVNAIPGIKNVTSFAISGSHAFFTMMHQGLGVLDLTDPVEPTLLSTLEITGENGVWLGGITLQGQWGYILDYGSNADLRVVDLSNPTKMELKTTLTLGNSPGTNVVNPAIEGSLLAAIVGPHGGPFGPNPSLVLVDISNPLAPQKAGRVPIAIECSNLTGLIMHNDLIYAACGLSGIAIYEIVQDFQADLHL
jgi:hypothetical protein